MTMKNIFVPELAVVKEVTAETKDVKTYRLAFEQEHVRDSFAFRAGQFVEFSVPGAGEATFCIASAPSDGGFIECSIKKVGRLTEAVHMLAPGDRVGIRGPYGNWFPLEKMYGKNLLFVGGGIGLAPLRSLIREVLHERDKYEAITILYGARSVGDLVYRRELEQWCARQDIKTVLTVDPGGETEEWGDRAVGFVPHILKEVKPDSEDCVAVTCGPPIMIKFTVLALRELKFSPDRIVTTLEMKMKCGLGQCGRCNVGPLYVCKDGPVFTFDQIQNFMEDIL